MLQILEGLYNIRVKNDKNRFAEVISNETYKKC